MTAEDRIVDNLVNTLEDIRDILLANLMIYKAKEIDGTDGKAQFHPDDAALFNGALDRIWNRRVGTAQESPPA